MTNSNKRFFDELNGQVSDIYWTMKINNIRNQKDVDYFCFVEGSSDERFYSLINHRFFSKNNIKYVYRGYHEPGEYKGKKAVILATKVVDVGFKRIKPKCVFIVDHDDYGLQEYSDDVGKKYLDMITVLPVYSFENFYFQRENINQILDNLVGENEKKKILLAIEDFHSAITDYYALKAVKTAVHSMRKYSMYKDVCYYKPIKKDDEIFNFNYMQLDCIDYESLSFEVEELKTLIIPVDTLRELYEWNKGRISNNFDFIKGHTIYDFLMNYLECNHKITTRGKNFFKMITYMVRIEIQVVHQ